MKFSKYILLLLIITVNINSFQQISDDKYKDLVKFINDSITNDPNYKHYAWEQTATFVDTFGPRLWGSEALELSLDYMKELLIREGFDNVKLEEFKMKRKWIRGNEKMTMLSPRPVPSNIPMIGLGLSVGGDITGEVVMISDWKELEAKAGEINGKIVFYNEKWVNYSNTVGYRTAGASKAAKYGAIGCVVRSVGPASAETPHTGTVNYDEKYPKIPAAAISLETADMFSRMIARGQTIKLHIQMEAKFEEGTMTKNIVGEITGSQYPNEILLLGGHIDSWDAGPQTGANDDAGGFMTCFAAIRFLIKNNLRPKRTIRFIAWSGEEMGEEVRGATAYLKAHENELENHVVVFENDEGTNDLSGFGFTGGYNGFHIVDQLAKLYLQDIKADMVQFGGGHGADIQPLYSAKQIPMMSNINSEAPNYEYYFTYHHTAADSMNIINPDFMDRNVIGTAAMFYLIADLPERLPKD
jgi:carboxypeptidase Q